METIYFKGIALLIFPFQSNKSVSCLTLKRLIPFSPFVRCILIYCWCPRQHCKADGCIVIVDDTPWTQPDTVVCIIHSPLCMTAVLARRTDTEVRHHLLWAGEAAQVVSEDTSGQRRNQPDVGGSRLPALRLVTDDTADAEVTATRT